MLAQVIHILINILLLLSVIFIITIIHELGHFALAKLCGMKVLRFSVGFGHPLYKVTDSSGTEYAIAPILLGGYVKLLDTREGEVSVELKPFAFDVRPVWQRLLVVLAGPGFNLIFAFLAFWLVFVQGITYIKPVIGAVIANSPAAQSGLKASEQIVSIDGKPTLNWAQVAMILMHHYGGPSSLVVTVQDLKSHTNTTQMVNLNLNNWHLNALRPQPLESLGLMPLVLTPNVQGGWPQNLLQTARFSFWEACLPAFQQEWDFISFNGIILYKMLTGVISLQSLGGPLSIFQAIILAAGQGLVIYVNFLGLLSVSIVIINLLPIPGLDGAQVVYSFWELLSGRPVSRRVQILAFRLGMIALLLLMFQATIDDLLRLW